MSIWSCTNELRWAVRIVEGLMLVNKSDPKDTYKVPDKQETVLQQKWISNTDDVEWRDVPIIKE